MSEEEVIRRRLLIDGDGTGDDRRLNVLFKNLIKWCETSDDSQESRAAFDKLLSQLAQCEYALAKSRVTSQMMAEELAICGRLSHTIENEIDTAKLHIENSKEELKHAKTIRKNRIEYDVLAKVINEQPDRKETEEKLGKLKKELTSLEENKQQTENKLSWRQKQFYVLINSISQLKIHLNETDSDDIMSISLEDIDENDESEKCEVMDIT